MRTLFFILGLALLPGVAAADAGRLQQGLSEGCLSLGGDPLSIPARMSEHHFWTYDQAPQAHDFHLVRDDAQIFLSARGKVACVVTDLRVSASAPLIEAALERKFPGAWSQSGGAWIVSGAKPLTIKIIETESGDGIAVETGS